MPTDLTGPLFCLTAYLLGSIPFGIVVSKFFGVQDPRLAGSKNIGFTNVLRLSGKKVGILTLVGDLGKGWVVGWMAVWIFADAMWPLLAVLAVVLGHMFPVFLKFHGGKGVATGLGGILGLDVVLGLILIGIWLVSVGIWKYSSGGALVAFASLPIVGWIMTERMDFVIFTLFLSGLIVLKHKNNINRLLNGTEPRMGSVVR